MLLDCCLCLNLLTCYNRFILYGSLYWYSDINIIFIFRFSLTFNLSIFLTLNLLFFIFLSPYPPNSKRSEITWVRLLVMIAFMAIAIKLLFLFNNPPILTAFRIVLICRVNDRNWQFFFIRILYGLNCNLLLFLFFFLLNFRQIWSFRKRL